MRKLFVSKNEEIIEKFEILNWFAIIYEIPAAQLTITRYFEFSNMFSQRSFIVWGIDKIR